MIEPTADLHKELEELSSVDSNDSSQLEEFLMNQPKDIQRRVRKTVEIWGIDKNDPYFLILLQSRITQILYELMPSEIQQAHDNGVKELTKTYEHYKQDLFREQEEQIQKQQKQALNTALTKVNNEIAKVMEDNNISYKNRRFSPRVVGSFITAVAMLVAGSIGFFGGRTFNHTSIAKDWQTKKDSQEQALIDWAKSDEGELARKVVDWNEDLIDRKCEQKVRSLGITFQMGSGYINSGFCVLFVAPASQRNFIETSN